MRNPVAWEGGVQCKMRDPSREEQARWFTETGALSLVGYCAELHEGAGGEGVDGARLALGVLRRQRGVKATPEELLRLVSFLLHTLAASAGRASTARGSVLRRQRGVKATPEELLRLVGTAGARLPASFLLHTLAASNPEAWEGGVLCKMRDPSREEQARWFTETGALSLVGYCAELHEWAGGEGVDGARLALGVLRRQRGVKATPEELLRLVGTAGARLPASFLLHTLAASAPPAAAAPGPCSAVWHDIAAKSADFLATATTTSQLHLLARELGCSVHQDPRGSVLPTPLEPQARQRQTVYGAKPSLEPQAGQSGYSAKRSLDTQAKQSVHRASNPPPLLSFTVQLAAAARDLRDVDRQLASAARRPVVAVFVLASPATHGAVLPRSVPGGRDLVWAQYSQLRALFRSCENVDWRLVYAVPVAEDEPGPEQAPAPQGASTDQDQAPDQAQDPNHQAQTHDREGEALAAGAGGSVAVVEPANLEASATAAASDSACGDHRAASGNVPLQSLAPAGCTGPGTSTASEPAPGDGPRAGPAGSARRSSAGALQSGIERVVAGYGLPDLAARVSVLRCPARPAAPQRPARARGRRGCSVAEDAAGGSRQPKQSIAGGALGGGAPGPQEAEATASGREDAAGKPATLSADRDRNRPFCLAHDPVDCFLHVTRRAAADGTCPVVISDDPALVLGTLGSLVAAALRPELDSTAPHPHKPPTEVPRLFSNLSGSLEPAGPTYNDPLLHLAHITAPGSAPRTRASRLVAHFLWHEVAGALAPPAPPAKEPGTKHSAAAAFSTAITRSKKQAGGGARPSLLDSVVKRRGQVAAAAAAAAAAGPDGNATADGLDWVCHCYYPEGARAPAMRRPGATRQKPGPGHDRRAGSKRRETSAGPDDEPIDASPQEAPDCGEAGDPSSPGAKSGPRHDGRAGNQRRETSAGPGDEPTDDASPQGEQDSDPSAGRSPRGERGGGRQGGQQADDVCEKSPPARSRGGAGGSSVGGQGDGGEEGCDNPSESGRRVGSQGSFLAGRRGDQGEGCRDDAGGPDNEQGAERWEHGSGNGSGRRREATRGALAGGSQGGDEDRRIQGGDDDKIIRSGDEDRGIRGGDKRIRGGDEDRGIRGGDEGRTIRGGDEGRRIRGEDKRIRDGDEDSDSEGGGVTPPRIPPPPRPEPFAFAPTRSLCRSLADCPGALAAAPATHLFALLALHCLLLTGSMSSVAKVPVTHLPCEPGSCPASSDHEEPVAFLQVLVRHLPALVQSAGSAAAHASLTEFQASPTCKLLARLEPRHWPQLLAHPYLESFFANEAPGARAPGLSSADLLKALFPPGVGMGE
ncbi:hypothetical protein DIPPA_03873 [Diplonema papillatum]|nr:hypothetical protein DIPPA_03873 [Diplonema papillatum]